MKPPIPSIAPDRLRPALSSFAEQRRAAQPQIAQPGQAPVRNPLMAACLGVAIAVFLWTLGTASAGTLSLSDTHPGAHSPTTIAKVWDKHQDLTRASVKALVPAATRRTQNSPTRIAIPCSAVPLPSAGYRLAEIRRPLALSANRSQIRLRAPPVLA
jgi:hypothetical protein